MGKKRSGFSLMPFNVSLWWVMTGARNLAFYSFFKTKVPLFAAKGAIDVLVQRYFTIMADDVAFAGSSAKIVRLGAS